MVDLLLSSSGGPAVRYISSISGLYFSFTSLRLSFIVGVSSSSSAVSFCSIRLKRLICSTRAKPAFTLSISAWISSRISRARHRLAKLVNGMSWSWAYFSTLSWSIITRHVRYGRRSPTTIASVM